MNCFMFDKKKKLKEYQMSKIFLIVGFKSRHTQVNVISKKLLEMDRGDFIRTEAAYVALAKQHFTKVTAKIDETYFRVPYTSIILNCSN